MQQVNIPIKKILANLKIETLNEMQLACIKTNDENDNVLLLSTTGSGKTIAFLIPVVQRLNPAVKTVQALILAPSRELAIQIDEVFRKIGSGYKVTCC
jgi:superfamily II DNA/RNA helicase